MDEQSYQLSAICLNKKIKPNFISCALTAESLKTMATHLQKEIEKLKKKILALGAMTEENVQKAVISLTSRDLKLAEEILKSDNEIDEMEVEIEEDCLKILALHQPVAIDLRFIVAVLKINNELERIADLSVNIAERAAFLSKQGKIDIPIDFNNMTQKVNNMLRRSLDSLVNMDTKLALEVLASDDAVDAINRDMFIQIQTAIRKDVTQIESLIHLLSASRHLERIADHATNVAEVVMYMINGEIIRHKAEEYKPLTSK